SRAARARSVSAARASPLPVLPPHLLVYLRLWNGDDPACEVDELPPGFLGVFAGSEIGVWFGFLFRFPRRCRPSGGGEERVTADQVLVRQPLADDGPYHVKEPLAIVDLPRVEAERLLVEVAERSEEHTSELQS